MQKSVKAQLSGRSRAEWETLIYQWIHNEMDRKMLVRRLLDGIIYEKLAEEFDLSVQQTKTRVYAAKKQLFEHL